VGLFAYPQTGGLVLDPDALVSGPDAAAYLPRVTGPMIRKWASRGWKVTVGPDAGERRKLEAVDHEGERGAARYRWQDLLDAERDTRRNPRSPGRGRALALA
jgi:hypothetical protein